MSNIIKENAIEGMMRGIEQITDLVRPTYGGAGTNVMVESNLYPYFQTTNDAQTIVQSVKLKDKAEKIGSFVLKEVCDKTDKLAGNGRKTTILMTTELLKEGYKYKGNKNQLKRELDALIPFIESEIDKQTKQITVDDVEAVATTASENPETGKLFKEIYQKIGKNGIISVEGLGTYETSYKITDGVKFEMTGMLSPEMVHDEEAVKDGKTEKKAVYENPVILVTKKKITTDDDINPLLKEMRNNDQKDLVIFTNDMDSGVASLLVALHKSKQYNILIIKAPVIWQNYVFEDFAKCVGATIVEDATGISLKSLKPEHLGTCGRIEVDGEDTILTGIKDISDHLKTLAEKGDDDSKIRLSWLVTKSAMLKLGANSHQDLSYKRLKANDANRSTYLALQYGIVPGGGICLYNIAQGLVKKDGEAARILSIALQVPLDQASKNYRMDCLSYISIINDNIVDASMVVKRTVRNAIGIASTILTSESLVFIPDKTAQEMEIDIMMHKQNPFNQ